MTRRARQGAELELKFELDKRSAKQVRRHQLLSEADNKTQALSSVYFDTHGGKIHKAGYSLRVRKAGDRFTQTVKSNGGSTGLFDRGEWEAAVDRMAPVEKALRCTPLRGFKKLHRKVEPVVRSDIDRTTWLLERDGSIIEAALDEGTAGADGKEVRLHELELELKCGKPAPLFELARQIGRDVPLHISVLSKEERGRLLLDGGSVRRAATPHLSKSMDAGQAFSAVVHECIRHFRLNEPLIISDRNPKALHQARVAVRRLRSAFFLFRPVIRQGSLEPLRNELREFAVPLGEARNLDVFLGRHEDRLRWRDRRKLTSAQAESYDLVIETLDSQQARDLFLSLVEWTNFGLWRKRAASTPIKEFAEKRLDRIWRKVKRKGTDIGDLEERELHQLRIAIKKLRYAVEFLAPLYARKRVRQFASSLEDMQDCLGLIHDTMVNREIVAAFGLDDVATDIGGRARQLRTMEQRFRHLRREGRFWAA